MLDSPYLRASDSRMPRFPHLINRSDPKADPEAFDVAVTLTDDSTASVTGDGLGALFGRLGEWGPGAANASFDLDLGSSALRHCKVMQYAAGHALLIRYNTSETDDTQTGA
jgi:hypothetical protein